MKRMIALSFCITVLLALLVGCTGVVAPTGDAAPAAATAAPAAEGNALGIEPVKIALILPSTINDISWSQSIYESLKAIQAEAGADVVTVAYSENMFSVPDAAAAIRDYAADGYDLVIAHGAQYGDSLFEVAGDFPEVSFAWGTTTNTGTDAGLTNVFAYELRGDEAGYVTGVLAAKAAEADLIDGSITIVAEPR